MAEQVTTYLPLDVIAEQRRLAALTNQELVRLLADTAIACAVRLKTTPWNVLAMSKPAFTEVEWRDIIAPELNKILFPTASEEA